MPHVYSRMKTDQEETLHLDFCVFMHMDFLKNALTTAWPGLCPSNRDAYLCRRVPESKRLWLISGWERPRSITAQKS